VNPIERTARRIDEFQQTHGPLAFAFAVSKKFGDDNAGALVGRKAGTNAVVDIGLLHPLAHR
jgi:hypothetical protein